MTDYLASLIRTVVPIAVGWLIATLANVGIDVDQTEAATALTALVMAIYYGAIRAAENRWPWLGWLLGLPKPPAYQ